MKSKSKESIANDPYIRSMEKIYENNCKCKERMLWTIYNETERALNIHAQQLRSQEISQSPSYNMALNKDVEQMLAKVQEYKNELQKVERQKSKKRKRSVDISHLKAVKFEPVFSNSRDNINNNSVVSDSILGCLVEYDINDLCGQVVPKECNHGIPCNTKDNKTNLIHEDIYPTPENKDLPPSQCKLVSSFPARRNLKLDVTNDADTTLTHSQTNSSITSLLWRSNSNLSKSSYQSHLNFPEGVTFLRNGELVVADTTEGNLQVYERTGSLVKVIGQDKIHKLLGDWKFKPQCVATSLEENNNIWVTDAQDKCIKLFDYDSERLVGKVPLLSYSLPYGLAILPNGNFVVTHCDDFITIHDNDGNTLSTIHGNGNFWYVATDSYGRIITSDCYNHCVKIFDTRGTLIGRFGEDGYAEGCLQYPHGVTVDPNGDILIADSLNHRVCQFNKNGKYIQTVLQGGDLYWPRGLATDIRGHIAVAWKDNVSVWCRSTGSHLLTTYL